MASQVRIAIDPFDEGTGLKVSKVETDILLVSHKHKDHSNIEAIKGNPFLIDTAGEFEIKGVFIKGISAFHDNNAGKERGGVVVFKIEAEEMKFCHLSDLGQKELTSEQIDQIGEVDILAIPVGGNYTIGFKEAASIISQIEPRVVIPMHYKIPNLKIQLDDLNGFLKIMGQENTQAQPKIKISPKYLPSEETIVMVLEP